MKRLRLIVTLLGVCFWAHPAAFAAESATASDTRNSPFAETFFSAGLANGRIEIVSFPGNADCLDGRRRISRAEQVQVMAKRLRPTVEERLRAQRPAGSAPATPAEIETALNAAITEREAGFCGPTIRGYHFKPEGAPKGLLLVVHGMQSNSAWFLSGEFLAQAGFEVLAFDRRGAGISDGHYGHVSEFTELLDDVDASVEFLRAHRTDIPMHLHANCFGTRIAIPYLQDHMEERTKRRLTERWQRENPSASAEELEWISGYRFVSVINTSPATHMTHRSEALIRDNLDCFMQFVQADKNWEPRERCLSKAADSYNISGNDNWTSELTPQELACVGRLGARDREVALKAECRPASLSRLTSAECQGSTPENVAACRAQLNSADQYCVEGLLFEAEKYISEDRCTAEIRDRLKADRLDPTGVALVRSPLTDDLFTTEPRFLQLIGADETALRALSRSFFYALHDLSTRMDMWLKGRIFNNQVLDLQFSTPVLVVLTKNDLMVENEKIVHQYFSAHRGKPQTSSTDVLNVCYRCNPRVMGEVNPAECPLEELRRCEFPQDVLECTDPAGEIAPCKDGDRDVSCRNPGQAFQQCADIRLKSARPAPRFRAPPRTIKRLVEINCEHFTEFCHDQSETTRYREAMREWLEQARWQQDWQEYFE